MSPSKICNVCGETKSIDNYRKHKGCTYGVVGTCRDCTKLKRKEAYWAKAAENCELSKQYNQLNAEKVAVSKRWGRLRRKYGLTQSDYESLVTQQQGLCAICHTIEPGGNSHGWLLVDHDHETGQVRGLLCHSCNTAIGHMEDDPDRLLAAATYILQYTNQLGDIL